MKLVLSEKTNKNINLVKSTLSKIPLPVVIILFMIPLRFINLGYSEYICDESVALDWLRVNKSFYPADFFISLHKGPMQYLIGGLVFLLTRDVFNELAYRIPFALTNCLSIAFFYLFIKNLTKNKFTAFFTAMLFGVNGLLVAFGRIFQYQSLNLLFSILALYFYSEITKIVEDSSQTNENKILRNSLIGTLFFCLSLLSHWDAIYILPFIFLVLLRDVLLKKSLPSKFKINFILFNFLIIAILFSVYLIPYIRYFINSSENQAYFQGRVSPSLITFSKFARRVKFIIFRIKLYNPLVFFEFHLFLLFVSLLFIKKTYFYVLWFISEIFIFTLIFTNPGTHIYNIFIPLLTCISLGVTYLLNIPIKSKKISKNSIKKFTPIFLLFLVGFLYYQSYVIFVNHNPEYPWKKKKILGCEVGNFTSEEKDNYLGNNKIGFPLRREWKQIEFILREYEKSNEMKIGETKIHSNENICPVNFYTNRITSESGERFVVAVKYPLSLVNDYKRFYKFNSKISLESAVNMYGDTTAKIYYVD